MQASAELICHPAIARQAVRRVGAEIGWDPQGHGLRLSFVVGGAPGELRFPPPGPAVRRDDLWRETCFELFLRPPAGTAYREFNFAPSGAWAAWTFADRRSGRRDLELPAAPAITCRYDVAQWQVEIRLPLAPEPALRAGLSAVLQERDGELSYWALAHGGPRQDFHDPATQTLLLEPLA
ncbi:MAG: DOMON-like domain-containing protein [Gammaproteobacteria bacterium]|nr:DOMON-like domain-containing protein [Gammaproteobacteria bacterium]